MSVVALCAAPGSTGVTTTAMSLGSISDSGVSSWLVAECDPSGGDVAAWAQLSTSPGWSSAVAASDRTWSGLDRHVQTVGSRQRVLVAPSRSGEARTALHAGRAFLPAMVADDTVVVADCGRLVVAEQLPLWVTGAQLTVLVVRQVRDSAPATVAVVDRALEMLDGLTAASGRVGVVLIGGAPYPPRELEAALDVPLLGALPEDPGAAAALAGAWTLRPGGRRSPLARAAHELAVRVVNIVGDAQRASSAASAEPSPVGRGST